MTIVGSVLNSAPANDPAFMAGALRTVMVDSNGVLSKPSNFIFTNNIFTKSNLLIGTNMVFVTNADNSVTISASSYSDVSFTNFDNLTIITNSGIIKVDTNVIATRIFLTNYLETATNGFVTSSITNGLAGTNQIYILTAGSGVDITTNNWELTFSGNTNVLASRTFLTNYIDTATNGFVTASITNFLAHTNWLPSVAVGTNITIVSNVVSGRSIYTLSSIADTNYLASRAFLTNYINTATNGFGTSSLTTNDVIPWAGVGYGLSSNNPNILDINTNVMANREFLTNQINLATNIYTVTSLLQGTNILLITNDGVITIHGTAVTDTNFAHLTLTNGLNLLTNSTITLHRAGYGDAVNFEKYQMSLTSTGMNLGTFASGTGTSNSMPIYFGTWGTNRWGINQVGQLFPVTEGTRLLLDPAGYSYMYTDTTGYNSYFSNRRGAILSRTGNTGTWLYNPAGERLCLNMGTSGSYAQSTGHDYFAVTNSARDNRSSLGNDTYWMGRNGFAAATRVVDASSFIFELGAGATPTSGTVVGGSGGDVRVMLKTGSSGSGGAAAGRAGQFQLFNSSTNLQVVFAGEGTNWLGGTTTISALSHIGTTATKSITNTWYSKEVDGTTAVTNVQVYINGILTSWTKNGTEL